MHGGGRARRVGKRIALLAAVAAILSAPFALVVVHLELTTNQLRLTNLQSQGDAAQKTYEKLRLEVAQLESPARIVATAQQLGMVTPTTIHYLTATTPSPAATNVEPQATPGLNGWATAKQVDAGR
jgi:cell division protein FtsL